MTNILIDDRISLKKPTRDDAKAVHRIIESNRHHLRWYFLENEATDVAQTIYWMEKILAPRHGVLIWFDDEIVGAVAMEVSSGPEDDTGEIHYWLSEEFQGQGLVTRSCRSLIHLGFNSLNLHRIVIRPPMTPWNRSR